MPSSTWQSTRSGWTLPFGHDGARAYQHITFVEPGADHDAAVRTVLAQPGVGHLHVRSAVAQCFTFAVRPV